MRSTHVNHTKESRNVVACGYPFFILILFTPILKYTNFFFTKSTNYLMHKIIPVCRKYSEQLVFLLAPVLSPKSVHSCFFVCTFKLRIYISSKLRVFQVDELNQALRKQNKKQVRIRDIH